MLNLLVGAWRKGKRAVHDLRRFSLGRPLGVGANGDDLVYEINLVYLEVGQGGVSPIRGWGAIAFLGMGILGGLLLSSLPFFVESWRDGTIGMVEMSVSLLLGSVVGIALLLLALFQLFASFFNVTDPIVRLDARRQKVWMWTGKGPIEMDWARLTPQVESSIATAYATVKVYRGQYAELGPDGKPRVTGGIPHVFQCGMPASSEEAVLLSMEYLRRYMEIGPNSVPRPAKLLSHRPKWYVMVNFFFGLADDWVAWSENKGKPGAPGMPVWQTFFAVLLFPILFPLQITNWLALSVAPKPKWPKELRAMHEAELMASRSALPMR